MFHQDPPDVIAHTLRKGTVCCPQVAGITDSRKHNKVRYLAVVLDMFACKVAGWEGASDMQVTLV